MKWTKQAGLVSCDTEARLISKLNRELKTKRASKTAKKVKTYAKSQKMQTAGMSFDGRVPKSLLQAPL